LLPKEVLGELQLLLQELLVVALQVPAGVQPLGVNLLLQSLPIPQQAPMVLLVVGAPLSILGVLHVVVVTDAMQPAVGGEQVVQA
jgi:hypothetical protein